MASWMSPGGHSIVKHPGALHRTLGIPQGQKIPMSAIKSAEHSSNPLTRKRAYLAETFKHVAHHSGRHAF